MVRVSVEEANCSTGISLRLAPVGLNTTLTYPYPYP
jgi:hypothetical protein